MKIGEYYQLRILSHVCLCKKVKLSLEQAVEAHRVVRRRGSHVF
jgi:hypothetical protein